MLQQTVSKVPTEWINSKTWCCFLSFTSIFLKNPALDIFIDSSKEVDLTHFHREIERPHYITRLPRPNSGEANSTFVPKRKERTDTIFLTSNLPTLYFIGNHGRVVLLTDNITIANNLWQKNRILEIVIIIFNRTDVNAYTWFPYRVNHCHRDASLEFLDSCNENCSWNSDLYPGKLPNRFNGCPIRYDSFHYPPNVYQDANGKFRGREVTLMETLANHHGFSIIYSKDDVFFMSATPEGEPIGAMGMLLTGETDFAYSTLTMQLMYVDFCQPLHSYNQGRVLWLLPTPKPKPVILNVFLGFSSTIWFSFLITTLVIATTVGCLSYAEGIPWLWIDIVAVVLATPPTSVSRSKLIRIFFFVAQLYSIHIAWFYQATLLGTLFSTPMEKQLETLAEAVDSGLTAILRSFMSYHYNKTDHRLWDIMLAEGGSIQEMEFNYSIYRLVVEEKSAFIMGMIPKDEVDMRKLYPDMAMSEMVYAFKETFAIFPRAPYGRYGSPLTEMFDQQVLHLIESGLFDFWTSQEPEFKPFFAVPKKTKNPINIEMLQIVFYILFCMLGISFIALAGELVIASRGSRGKLLPLPFFNKLNERERRNRPTENAKTTGAKE